LVRLAFGLIKLAISLAAYTIKFMEQNVVVNCSIVFISKPIFIAIKLPVFIILALAVAMVSITGLILVIIAAFTIRFNLVTKLISIMINIFAMALVFAIELISAFEFILIASIIELV
jgi:hypothetical protein